MDILYHSKCPLCWREPKGLLKLKLSTVLLNSNTRDPNGRYHGHFITIKVKELITLQEGREGCNSEAKDLFGGGVNFFFLSRRGVKALLTRKTLLPLEQSIGPYGCLSYVYDAYIFSLLQAASEPTENSRSLTEEG